ncbi:MAG: type II secretion system protein J [Phycisphaerales bacterium JB043]
MLGRRKTTRGRRAFSLVEMLLALTISATLLTAALASLNSSFIQYKVVTESASTHVVTRMVMHRMLSMIRTGRDFGPFPNDVLDTSQNPVVTDFIEFVSERDFNGGINRITRMEWRPPGAGETAGSIWYVLLDPALIDPMDSFAGVIDEHILLPGVRSMTVTMEYEIGPQLMQATLDMTVEPNDSRDLTIGAVADVANSDVIRLVASAAPRQLF